MVADMRSKIAAVDLFCGAGGLTHGLESTGVRVVAGVDIDPACEHAYTANNEAIYKTQDVAGLEAKIVRKWLKHAEMSVLVGCAPCQPFSSLKRDRGVNDDRWSLVSAFSKLAAKVKPHVISMENVPALAKRDVFSEFIKSLEDAGYVCSWSIVRCEEYGLAQRRKRLVLLASRLGKIEIISASRSPQTVQEAIGSLKTLVSGECDTADPLHRASQLSELNLRRIRASVPGGTWRDWPVKLRAACHTKKSGKAFPSVYGRLSWDKPAQTMTTTCTTYGCGRFGHPEQDRGLTPREAALLQGFPIDYSFVENDDYSVAAVARLIGNAVPPPLGEAIGQSIVKHYEEHFS